MKLSRRCKEYCEVKKESFGQVRSPQDLSYVRSPEDLSVGLSIKERKVQGPESAGFILRPEDLSVGPSIWKEVGLSIWK